MQQLGKMTMLLVSGAFLWGNTVSADPERYSGRDRYQDRNFDVCKGNHDCRSRPDNDDQDRDNGDRQDRNERRQPYYTDNRDHRWDRGRDWERDRDWNRPRYHDNYRDYTFRPRIPPYPVYMDRRPPRYAYRDATPYWLWNHGYRPYYYRGRTLVLYPYQPWVRPTTERIYWMEETRQVTVPQETAQRNDQYCREYTSEADVNGRIQQVYGTACMQPDGSWRIVE